MRKAKKAQNRVVISLVILLALGAAALIITLVMMPRQKYNRMIIIQSAVGCRRKGLRAEQEKGLMSL